MEPTAQPAATDPVASGQPSTYPATGQPYPGAAQATAQYPTTSYPTQQYPAQQYGTQQYGAQQYGTQAGNRGAAPGGAYATGPRTALPPQGPTTALPRVASPRGPGSGASGVIVALSLLTFAALLYAQKVGSFEGPVLLTAGAVALILIGVGIIVAGLRGRTSGGLTALAIVLALVVVPGVAIDRTDWDIDGRWDSDTAFGEIDETPLDAATAEAGYSLGAGDARIDLTEVPLTGATVEVPVSLGAGDLTIVIPQDAAVTATIQVMAGEVRWLDESSSTGMPGSRGDQTYESPAVRDGATPDLELDLTVGAGTVRVMEENR